MLALAVFVFDWLLVLRTRELAERQDRLFSLCKRLAESSHERERALANIAMARSGDEGREGKF